MTSNMFMYLVVAISLILQVESFVTPVSSTYGALPAPSSTVESSSHRQRQWRMIPDHQLLNDLLVQVPDMDSTAAILSSLSSTTTQWLAEDAADGGSWWDAYINIFEVALKFVHSTIDGPFRSVGIDQTWGISIFIFTALIRSALLPLSIQQSKSAEYMKALKPYIADIKTKFKGNDDAITRATGKLYEDANQNPLAGCLVSLVQLPVFLGLYRGVRQLAIDNQLNEPFLWIPSLEGPVTAPSYQGLDWLVQGWTNVGGGSDGGLPIPPLGWETTTAFLIMPLVLVVLQSVTMRVLQPPVEETMSEDEKKQMETTQQVFKFLPLLIGVFSLQVPAGLTIYWFTSNIFTLSQSLGVRAYFAANPPKVELPDYWDTALTGDGKDMTPEERRKASEAGIRVGPSFDDLVDEARFHCRIERPAIRTEDNPAWQRVVATAASSTEEDAATNATMEKYPASLRAWVENAATSSRGSTESVLTAAVAAE